MQTIVRDIAGQSWDICRDLDTGACWHLCPHDWPNPGVTCRGATGLLATFSESKRASRAWTRLHRYGIITNDPLRHGVLGCRGDRARKSKTNLCVSPRTVTHFLKSCTAGCAAISKKLSR